MNVAGVEEYAERIQGGESVTDESECLPPGGRLGETIMLGLRTAEGVSRDRLGAEYAADLLQRLAPIAQDMQQAGLLEITPTHWRPTLRGMMLNNRLAGAFL